MKKLEALKEKFYQKESKIFASQVETTYKPSTNIHENVLSKQSFYPYELVVVFNDGSPEIHTALYWLSLQELKQQQELAEAIRAVLTTIAIMLSIAGIVEGGPVIMSISITDTIVLGTGLSIEAFEDQLLANEFTAEFVTEFKKFLDFYALAVSIIFTPILIVELVRTMASILYRISGKALNVLPTYTIL